MSEKISFDVIVRLPCPRPTVGELGVLRRAFPAMRDMSVAEAWAWLRRAAPSAARAGHFYFEVGLKADAEEAVRICRKGGLDAEVF